MDKIILIGCDERILGEWEGVWGEEIWNVVNEDCEVGVEFGEWGKEEEEGDGWCMYGYDRMGVLVVDEKKNWMKCYKEYWKMVLGR